MRYALNWRRPGRFRAAPPAVEPLESRCLLSIFAPPVGYAARERPRIVVTGDFNNDKVPDLAAAHDSAVNVVSVLLGNGNATFRPAAYYQVSSNATGLATGDFDGDGALDLVTANRAASSVSVLLGNGDGSFRAGRDYTAGRDCVFVAAGDADGDGWLDLAVANYGSGTISVLLGNGDGSFRLPAHYVLGGELYSVMLGDVDGDGAADLAAADAQRNRVAVLLGNGDGTFQTAVTYAAGAAPFFALSEDVDGDGVPDLVVVNYLGGNVSVLRGRGDGTFLPAFQYAAGPGPLGVAADDVNGDGAKDLVTPNRFGNSVSVLLGNGDGSFRSPLTFAAGAEPVWVVLADFNGDGRPDAATADFAGEAVSVLLNTSRAVASFYVLPQYAQVTAGVASDLFIFALDARQELVREYTGEIFILTSDPLATRPDVYRFRPEDQGIAVFFGGVTFRTPGLQVLLVFDTATFSVFGYAVFDVLAPAPGRGLDPAGLLASQPDSTPATGAASPDVRPLRVAIPPRPTVMPPSPGNAVADSLFAGAVLVVRDHSRATLGIPASDEDTVGCLDCGDRPWWLSWQGQ